MNFAISASLGSLAGLMWCLDKGFVAGQDFTFLLAIDLIIGLVLGGVGTIRFSRWRTVRGVGKRPHQANICAAGSLRLTVMGRWLRPFSV